MSLFNFTMIDAMICYATKRGTAEAAARRFGEVLHMPVMNLADAKPENLKPYKKLVFVISNYGKGEAPPTCLDFFDEFEAIQDKEYFKGVQYAVFGCGSIKKEPYFLHFTKYVEQKMAELGAEKVCEMGFVDSKNPDKSSIETWPLTVHFTEN